MIGALNLGAIDFESLWAPVLIGIIAGWVTEWAIKTLNPYEMLRGYLGQLGSSRIDPFAIEPPAATEFLLILLSKKKYGGSLIGDLDELFQKDIKRGLPLERARRRYRAEALKSICPLSISMLRRMFKRLLKKVGILWLWKSIGG